MMAGFASTLGLGCGDGFEPIDKPVPPDMSAVVARFERPTGVFSRSYAEAVLEHYLSEAARIMQVNVQALLIGVLRVTIDETSDKTSPKHKATASASVPTFETFFKPQAFESNGSVFFERICPGWAEKPVVDRDNGTLTGTLNFSESGLDPVVWSRIRGCRFRLEGVNILLGDDAHDHVRLWLGHGVTFASFGQHPILFDVDLSAEVAGLQAPFELSFRFDPEKGTLAIVIDIPSDPPLGSVIVSSNASAELTVEAGNGTFQCNLSSRECTSDSADGFTF